MAAAAGLRALGAKGSGWLRRGPWAPLTTGFCSGGPAGIGRPEPGPRPTIARQQDGIRSIVLSDPKRRNALSLAMLKSLQSDILHEAESQDLKVIIISAEGPVFSSGHDLKELTDEQGPDYHAEVFQTCSENLMTSYPDGNLFFHGWSCLNVPDGVLSKETTASMTNSSAHGKSRH